ncbi:glycerol-3-phosphate dehydrogenase, partial [Trifolium medium]|nr:glycerol-3-phosphate dehydrogenase [Trifolium medium]
MSDIWHLADSNWSPQCRIVINSAIIHILYAIWTARNNVRLKEVIWQPPLNHWVKCNTDGASTLTSSACGGIFRNSKAEFLCGFAENT